MVKSLCILHFLKKQQMILRKKLKKGKRGKKKDFKEKR